MAYTSYANDRSASAMTGAQDLFAQMVAYVVNWNQARRTRAALQKLSDHELEDIGLSRGDIDQIASKGRI
ncbi:MAG: DUF1127 domain-containing protein [Silicimonas sp.]|nr:DUF1127 domain-containing protein [Silicimonas sp.]